MTELEKEMLIKLVKKAGDEGILFVNNFHARYVYVDKAEEDEQGDIILS